MLIRAGANLESPDQHLGNTPLHEAAFYGRTALCKVLMIAGAVKDTHNRCLQTPSELAEEKGHLRTVQTIASHCNPRARVGEVLSQIERIEYGGIAGKTSTGGGGW